ncbi:MAG: hypothetical protein Q7T74_00430, partial [Candidatus Saccharibacteria bacterium]|nr:hypothetical protein [Candidatus Saccharibacteria bacterium]
NNQVKYDPKVHEGLLHLAGQEIIIANAKEAKLKEMPENVRLALAEATVGQLKLMDFSRGIGGVILELTDPDGAAVIEEGYKLGLHLLGFEFDPETFAIRDWTKV